MKRLFLNASASTLVSLSWVLTSSQEIFQMRQQKIVPGTLIVYANITSFADLSSAHIRNVSKVQAEPTQTSEEDYPNLVLLKLQEPFSKIPNQIESVHLNNGRLDWTCILVGWGHNFGTNAMVAAAWYQNSVPFTAKQCDSKFRLVEFPSQMCIRTSIQTNWTATAGSPLICSGALTALKHIDTYFTQSYSYRISVFIRLRVYIDWIESIAQDIPPLVNLKTGIDEEEDYYEPWLDGSTNYPSRRVLIPYFHKKNSSEKFLDLSLVGILGTILVTWNNII